MPTTLSGRILVLSPDPERAATAFIAPLGDEVEVVIVDVELVVAAVVARVRVIHRAIGVFVEDAVPFALALVIVAGLMTRLVLTVFLTPALYALVARPDDRLQV